MPGKTLKKYAEIGPRGPSKTPWPPTAIKSKKDCFQDILGRSQNWTLGLPRPRLRGLGRPQASQKAPRGDTGAPKWNQKTVRKQKMRFSRNTIFCRPCRGAEHLGPFQNHPKATRIGSLEPQGGSSDRLWPLESASGATQEPKNQSRTGKEQPGGFELSFAHEKNPSAPDFWSSIYM